MSVPQALSDQDRKVSQHWDWGWGDFAVTPHEDDEPIEYGKGALGANEQTKEFYRLPKRGVHDSCKTRSELVDMAISVG